MQKDILCLDIVTEPRLAHERPGEVPVPHKVNPRLRAVLVGEALIVLSL